MAPLFTFQTAKCYKLGAEPGRLWLHRGAGGEFASGRPMKMNDEDLRAHIFMVTVVLALLIDKARQTDPDFDSFAKRQFDILLGIILKGRGAPGNVERKARENFLGLLKTSWGELNIDPGTRSLLQREDRPLTWRRRFLDWLERG